MKAIVTGYKGFIGKNLYDYLTHNNYEVAGIEREFMMIPDWQKELDRYVRDADIIFHVGAISDVSMQNYNTMLKYNFEFSKVLFNLSSTYDKKVIYTSSSAVYGNGDLPENIYAWSKYLAEQYGLKTVNEFVSLRYFNVYGPHEEHKGSMQSLVKHIYDSESFKIFPVNASRDFVYVDDVVRANLHAAKCESGIYDVGTGESYTYESICEVMDVPYEYDSIDNVPVGYQRFTKADSNRFMPGWQARYDIELGVTAYKNYLDAK